MCDVRRATCHVRGSKPLAGLGKLCVRSVRNKRAERIVKESKRPLRLLRIVQNKSLSVVSKVVAIYSAITLKVVAVREWAAHKRLF
jgi:hypothetical protein